MATCSIQLSPGDTETVTAEAAIRAGVDRAHVGCQQALTTLRFVHRCAPAFAQPRNDFGIGAVDVLDDYIHHNSSTVRG